MFPLVISVSRAHLISQYLLIYLVLCNLLMLGLGLTQPACLMRYMYKSIFLLGPVPFCSAFQVPLFSGVSAAEKLQLMADGSGCVCVLCSCRLERGSEWKRRVSSHIAVRELSHQPASCSGGKQDSQDLGALQQPPQQYPTQPGRGGGQARSKN